jgi:hypothetical protein
MPLDGRFITSARNGLDDRGGNHVSFSALRPNACLYLTEARTLRRCVARPSQEYQQNRSTSYSTMEGGNVSHSCRPTAHPPKARGELQRRASAGQRSTRLWCSAARLRAGPLGYRLAATRTLTTGTDVGVSARRAPHHTGLMDAFIPRSLATVEDKKP